jgi:hypothetical protein
MAGGHQCHHCKQWVAEGEPYDCWTTTEAALTRHLPEDLQDAYERLRETAVEFGDQRIYASHHSIMFSRRACYCFVRPRRKDLELVVFLGRVVTSPQIVRAMPASRVKHAHLIRITHRDQVEAPLTDWMREAYAFAGEVPPTPARASFATGDATPATASRRAASADAVALPRKRAAKKR